MTFAALDIPGRRQKLVAHIQRHRIGGLCNFLIFHF